MLRPGPITPRTGPGRGVHLIIDRPELQARRHRWVYSTLTLLAWIVWMYLWLPLVTFVAWYFGFRTFFRTVVVPDAGALLAQAFVLVAVIIVLGAMLILWSRYNLRRFQGKDRRKHPRETPDEEMEQWFDVSPQELRDFRTGRTLVLEHGEKGEVTAVKPRIPAVLTLPATLPEAERPAAGV